MTRVINILILPEPSSIEGIARLFSTNRLLDSGKDWLAKSPYVERSIRKFSDGKTIPSGTREYDQLNLHLLFRSLHQANEACNKLWSTIELYHHAKDDRLLCKKFSPNFLSSSAIPTLHYANCSALISLMSLFGLGSLMKRTPYPEFFNLVRTSDRFFLLERVEYLNKLLGHAPRGWHWQVLATYAGLVKKGIALPDLDLDSSRKLLIARNKCHYEVLGHTTMFGVYGSDEFFQFVPTVISSVSRAITGLRAVLGPLPNKSDRRFRALLKATPTVFKNYGKHFALAP